MRDIHVERIKDAVARLCMEANYDISPDIHNAFCRALPCEKDALSRDVLEKLLENAAIAAEQRIPICQDTGMAVIFLEVGQEVHITGGSLTDAVNAGVAKGYEEGYLRKSVVADPIRRDNTRDNTPAVIHTAIVPGDRLVITVSPKGFGSENMSALSMLKPSQGLEGIKDFVIETVRKAGPNPCPPIIVGVGVGGTMEKAAVMAKEALLRDVGTVHGDPFWADVEQELLQKINSLGIGPGGFGGKSTALAVHINVFATHIAGLPIAVNIGCHVTRHKTIII